MCENSHISLFLEEAHSYAPSSIRCYEFAEFHVTFEVYRHNLHFYYHEIRYDEWLPEGHTSTAEVTRLGYDACDLKTISDEIAEQFVKALDGRFLGRQT